MGLAISDQNLIPFSINFSSANNKTVGVLTQTLNSAQNFQITGKSYVSVVDSNDQILFQRTLPGIGKPFCFDSLSNFLLFDINMNQELNVRTFLESSSYADSLSHTVSLPAGLDTVFLAKLLDANTAVLAFSSSQNDYSITSLYSYNIARQELTPLFTGPEEFTMYLTIPPSRVNSSSYGYTVLGENLAGRKSIVYRSNPIVNTTSPRLDARLFTLYPNPSTGGELSIQQLSETRAVSYDLIAPNGTLLTQQQELHTNSMIPLPQAAGMYFIRITDTAGGVTVLKHVVR